MIHHLLLGPPSHGVTRHGEALAGPVRTRLEDVGPNAQDFGDFLASHPTVHLHLTDHLLGDDAETVMRAVEMIGSAHAHVTLHDIPQPAEGEARYARRRAIYARLVEVAASVQVCSDAERVMLKGMSARRGFGVVPLPIDVRPLPAVAQRSRIGVLGFIHPGKNPEMALDVAAATGQNVILMGAVAPGHEVYARELVTRGEDAGVHVEITGFLDENALDDAIASVAVPLAPYRHISASGSIGRWIAAGRRPITLETPWAQELAARAPWSVQVVQADDVAEQVRAALARPDLTMTGGRSDGLISTQDAAAMQAHFLQQVSDD